MFENVVVGIDGAQGGRDAVCLARRLARPDARATIAHVYGGMPVERGGGISFSEERDKSQALLEREREQCWPGSDTASVYATSAGRGLHELAQQRGADLLGVGSCGPFGRVLMRDDARAAFTGAPCAIAIAPRGYSSHETPIATIAVGYDGRPESQRALAAAGDLAARTGARIQVLRVVTGDDVRRQAPLPADWPEASRTMVEQMQQQLRKLKGVETTVVYGGPREQLRQLGGHSDLLIVGSRGYGPLGSVLHGSVSSWLERRSACPLLILPRDTSRDHAPALEPAEPIPASA
jgi:nucleotide-binding universal stress UspA family protein